MKKNLRLLPYIMFCIIVCLHTAFVEKFLCSAKTVDIQTSVEDNIAVTELDLGEYVDVMSVGEKQLLTITVLPLNSTENNINYLSSNPSVAIVNGLGRITAVGVGETIITASCGEKSASFRLTVTEKKDETVAVSELDMGEYPDEMEIGSTQVLSITVLPLNATETVVTYESSNEEVASINSMGRINALCIGTTTIKASCGGKSASFLLKVVKKKDDKIAVTDIEISDHEKELAVEKTLTLTANIIPSDATDSRIVFRSSDESVATVNSSGEVKGISKGKVIIYASAGKVTKKIPLHIKIETTSIKMNNSYLIMKPGETYQLAASVTPSGAEQSITYSIVDKMIASITPNGLVTALSDGNTAIIVSNGDTSVAVSVIVNQLKVQINDSNQEIESHEMPEEYSNIVDAAQKDFIDTDTLYYLYANKQFLKVVGEGYLIEIDGNNIVNCENKLYTDIGLSKDESGTHFVINQKQFICGEITLIINEPDGEYLYLYNDAKKKYELVSTDYIERLSITIPGEYLITDKKIQSGTVYVKHIIIVGAIFVIIGTGIYIGLKKKYWFW